ncbi:MAG: NAD(P)-dependent oxidoreductase [Dorea sp.]|uniref:SDR family oxidoreductase n=1 Tax=Sporofaciens musculi TaxID=2681861 RepID=UPI0021727ECD|nr:sugar nucleotide-binding protein [Sporofaciens musculi]MCI9421676.1 NAD(P)-dependent oxidoreductase [Dorea sp.]
MKKLLVTGASGFLGRRIAEFYSEKYELYTPGHKEMDITDREKVSAVFHDFKPNFVIHSAAVSDVGMCERDPEGSWRINVDGSRNIATASAELHAKCIICSSDQIYFGSQISGPHREDEEVNPLNVYGREKKKAEEVCLAENPECVLLRLSWMYDTITKQECEHGDFFRTLILSLETSKDLYYPVNDVRGITDVNEVIRNLEKAWELKGGSYNFGSPNNRNTYEMVFAMFSELGWDTGRIKRNEDAFATAPRDISMNLEKINHNGIVFTSTLDSLVRNGVEKYR